MKIHKLLPVAILFSVSIIFQGCIWPNYGGSYSSSPTRYRYNTEDFFKGRSYNSDKPFKMMGENPNAPLLTHKGQVNFSFGAIHGFDTHFAFAASDKISVIAGGSLLNTKDESNSSVLVTGTAFDEYYNGTVDSFPVQTNMNYTLKNEIQQQSFYAGAGLYKTFAGAGRWENYTGIELGKATEKYTYTTDVDYNFGTYSFTETRNYFNYFLQENFGYVTDNTDGALIARLSWIHFTKRKFEKDYPVGEYAMTSNNLLFQPAIKFSFGGEEFRLYAQCGWNVPLTKSDLKWCDTNVRAGIVFRIFDKKTSY